jgi:hypothetical protein
MKAILKETGDEETFVAVMASSSTRRTRRRATRRSSEIGKFSRSCLCLFL